MEHEQTKEVVMVGAVPQEGDKRRGDRRMKANI